MLKSAIWLPWRQLESEVEPGHRSGYRSLYGLWRLPGVHRKPPMFQIKSDRTRSTR